MSPYDSPSGVVKVDLSVFNSDQNPCEQFEYIERANSVGGLESRLLTNPLSVADHYIYVF